MSLAAGQPLRDALSGDAVQIMSSNGPSNLGVVKRLLGQGFDVTADIGNATLRETFGPPAHGLSAGPGGKLSLADQVPQPAPGIGPAPAAPMLSYGSLKL